MTTLLSVGNSEGTRRCDARCYNAQHAGCDCICRGKNHGVGLARAQENTRELAEVWLDRYAAARGITRDQLKAEIGIPQEPLL